MQSTRERDSCRPARQRSYDRDAMANGACGGPAIDSRVAAAGPSRGEGSTNGPVPLTLHALSHPPPSSAAVTSTTRARFLPAA